MRVQCLISISTAPWRRNAARPSRIETPAARSRAARSAAFLPIQRRTASNASNSRARPAGRRPGSASDSEGWSKNRSPLVLSSRAPAREALEAGLALACLGVGASAEPDDAKLVERRRKDFMRPDLLPDPPGAKQR